MTQALSHRITENFGHLTPIAPECCIFKLHRELRNVNEKAYEPVLVGIGPYNHGKIGLELMEEHKLRYLQQMLARRNENGVDPYVSALHNLEGEARKYYADQCQSRYDFLEMLLLDGCFIIEFFRKRLNPKLRDRSDPIFDMDWMHCSIVRDLLLFENQLPFFVLVRLFAMSDGGPGEIVNDSEQRLVRLAFSVLSEGSPWPWTPTRPSAEQDRSQSIRFKHLLDLMHKASSFPRQQAGLNDPAGTADWTLLHSATELHEAGVKFKKGERGNIFGIKFKNGLLEISPLTINDETETKLRNLIAYEQYSRDKDSHYATDYMCFLDDLINSSKDVEFLRRRGIIENLRGDDEVISTMVNKLGHNVYLPHRSYIYAKTKEDLNKHCSRRQNLWMANLRHNYFNSPWSVLSFLAAVLLLSLTFTQTLFSIR